MLLHHSSRGKEFWLSVTLLTGDRVVTKISSCRVNTRGGGTLGISGWGCAAGILEPLTYTRASSAEFWYPILE